MYDKYDAKSRLAHHVRRVRKMLGMTQAVLAESAGVEQSMISSIESGSVVPNYVDVANIAEALNTNTESLLKPVPKGQLAEV